MSFADIVMFVFREAYYHAMEKPNDDKGDGGLVGAR
jgi:hypothetical protein